MAALQRREQLIRVGLSAAAVLVLLVAAGFAFVTGYVFFTVVLVVLAVFAAVEMSWALRRRRRKRRSADPRSAGGAGHGTAGNQPP